MNKVVSLYSIMLIFLLSGCDLDQSKRGSSSTLKLYTEAQLDQLITPGMSAAEITNVFGIPDFEIQFSESGKTLSYSFPFDPSKEGHRLAGFDVHFEDGKVVQWSPILGGTHKMFGETDESGPEYSYGEQTFAFFTLSDGLTNALRQFESGEVADTGSLGVAPDVMVKAQVFAGVAKPQSSAGKSIRLVIDENDVARLSGFCEKNFGRRVLIVLKNQVIAAPAMTTPATSKQFRFRINDASVLGKAVKR